MKLLITGANGQLGRCLQDRVAGYDGVEAIAYTSSDLDICSPDAVADKLGSFMPDLVVNAAAYTAVDQAEDERDRAFAVNRDGTMNLAKACNECSLPLIHVSTDYVFDGQASSPYLPNSPTNPIGAYGASKLAGELAAQAVLESLVIIRTAWVYSEYGNNFVKTMLRLAASRDEVAVVDDQIGCPTYAGNIAAAILGVCREIFHGKTNWGVYHYVDKPSVDQLQTSWYDFAVQIFSEAKSLGLIEKDMRVKAIPSSEYPTKTERPAYSVLGAEKIYQDYGVSQSLVSDSLVYVLKRLQSESVVE